MRERGARTRLRPGLDDAHPVGGREREGALVADAARRRLTVRHARASVRGVGDVAGRGPGAAACSPGRGGRHVLQVHARVRERDGSVVEVRVAGGRVLVRGRGPPRAALAGARQALRVVEVLDWPGRARRVRRRRARPARARGGGVGPLVQIGGGRRGEPRGARRGGRRGARGHGDELPVRRDDVAVVRGGAGRGPGLDGPRVHHAGLRHRGVELRSRVHRRVHRRRRRVHGPAAAPVRARRPVGGTVGASGARARWSRCSRLRWSLPTTRRTSPPRRWHCRPASDRPRWSRRPGARPFPDHTTRGRRPSWRPSKEKPGHACNP